MDGRLVVILFLFSFCVVLPINAEDKFVNIALQSNWKRTPLLLDVCEFIANEDNELFWKFVEEMGVLESSTEQDQYQKILQLVPSYLSNVQKNILNYATSFRFYSPRVQLYRHLFSNVLSELSIDLQDKVKPCKAWVSIGQNVACSVEELKTIINSGKDMQSVPPLEIDHIYPTVAGNDAPVVYLYAIIGSKEFLEFHKELKEESSNRKVKYVFRHLLEEKADKMNLGGYGIELAIKSLEYKAEDDSKVQGTSVQSEVNIATDEEEVQGFLFGTLLKRKPHLASELSTFKSILKASDEKFEDLKVWNLRDLGYQASQRIVSSSNPLRLMRDISQNFPTHAISLSRVKFNDTFKSSLKDAASLVIPGDSIMVLNGRMINIHKTDPYSLFTLLKEEAQKLDSLTRLHIPKMNAFRMLSHGSGNSEETQRFDIRGNEIQWINNLESDPFYSNWPRGFNEILRPVWPGSFHYIARNFFSIVLVIDPSHLSSFQMMIYLESFLQQNVPIRIGLLFVTEDITGLFKKVNQESFELEETSSLKLARAFLYLHKTVSPRSAISFLRMVGQMGSSFQSLDESMLQSFVQLYNGFNSHSVFKDVIKSNEYDDLIRSINKFVIKKGLTQLPIGFMNGVPVQGSSSDVIIQGLINQYFYQIPNLQSLVMKNQLKPDSDIYESILSGPNVFPRFNPLVLETGESLRFFSLSQEKLQNVLNSVQYFTNVDDQDSIKPVTQLIEVNPNSLHSLQIAFESLNQLEIAGNNVRVGFIYNPSKTDETSTLIPRALMAAFPNHILTKSSKFARELLKLAIGSFDTSMNEPTLKMENVQSLAKDLNLKEDKIIEELSSKTMESTISSHKAFWLSIQSSSDTTILANGRILKVPTNIPFSREDLRLLTIFEENQRASKIRSLIDEITFTDMQSEDLTSNFLSDVVMKAVSVLGLEEKSSKKINIPPQLKSTFTVGVPEQDATFLVTAILNPLSVEAQKITPILETLVNFFDTHIKILLNPTELGELPLKNFYTYVLPEKPEFDSQGNWVGPTGTFNHLPVNRLLTLNLDVPESWLVTPVIAPYDLDNIRLQDVSDRVLYAQFELVNILVEGNCFEMNPSMKILQAPPRGLELVLGVPQQPHVQDTIVMSNLGYFQLKANPGVWTLRLKKDSRSSELYQIVQESSAAHIENQTILLTDFTGTIIPLRVQKLQGKEGEHLLVEGDELADQPSNMWDTFTGIISGKDGGVKPNTSNETIHVFSLASGHLYERFLKIMMLSVIKHTKSPVKFWLLANFLSPKFKDFIPFMAKKYNFEYSLVTYKWPSWLHKQTEKQRIIWGYKILFLDVLFPLDLKKVVYVDADQVVRADLKELWNLDLHGAPYAYTPFCQGPGVGNPETNGFRFWSHGFWENHLKGRPYHISALYLVDLKQFRKIAAGDNLRATYASLSQDPNSLANLDQDLPNYLQHMVKIHSLPTEWLWCETWCSQEIKFKAKTIDLCNNPLTKTPKLVNAVRIIPEWVDLDNEVKALENEINSKNGAKVLLNEAKQVL